MKKVALYVIAVALAGILFGVASLNATQEMKATGFSEGSYPAPLVKPGVPVPQIAGEGSYPTPACSPQNPKCGGTGTSTTIAGEGSYPTPACSPQNPKCGGTGTSTTIAGEGSYPTPACSPQNPKCGGTGTNTTVALLGDGGAPVPLYLPGGMD